MNQTNISWQEALDRLKEGNARFVNEQNKFEDISLKKRNELTGGQNPFAIILSCADSRVAPEYIFDQGLGDIFVVRVAGNIANTSSIASIEYAVDHLGVNLIVVMGHESCGAVGAAIQGGDFGYNLNHLLAHIQPALSISKDLDINQVVRKNAEHSAMELQERSPIIRRAVRERLKIIPAYYRLADGSVEWL